MLTPLPLDDALRWTERLTGLAITLGTLELLALRRAYADDGIWRWSTLRAELPWLSAVLAYRPFIGVLIVQLGAAMALLLGVGEGPAAVLWITSFLVCLRFRGSFNGGSDAMLMVVLSALVLARWDADRPVLARAAMLYVAVQLTLSYVVAGVAKLRHAEWRNGTALAAFVRSPQYGVPPFVERLLQHRVLAALAGFAILIFECVMPVAWIGAVPAVIVIGTAGIFHLGNVLVFGLNRFLWIWLATYPALYYAATSR